MTPVSTLYNRWRKLRDTVAVDENERAILVPAIERAYQAYHAARHAQYLQKKDDPKEKADRRRVRMNAYYRNNDNARYTEKRRQKLDALIALLGGCCVDCGGKFHRAVYDFHHREPHTKEKQISLMLQHSWKNIVKEAEKCDLLCANCHRMRHVRDDKHDHSAVNTN